MQVLLQVLVSLTQYTQDFFIYKKKKEYIDQSNLVLVLQEKLAVRE